MNEKELIEKLQDSVAFIPKDTTQEFFNTMVAVIDVRSELVLNHHFTGPRFTQLLADCLGADSNQPAAESIETQPSVPPEADLVD